jgi:glycosyltransferase involved in cell wall biosynthesis
MTPEVTAIVPTRNRAEMLRRTVERILAQQDVSLELIVVDEGSSDDTPAYLASLTDARVRVVRHDEAKGLPAARNAGLAAATGRVLAFCDDDDLWAPTKLRAQLDAMAASGARWSVTGVVIVDVDDRVIGHVRAIGGEVGALLRVGNVIPGGGSAVIAEAALVQEVGGFDESLRAAEDYDMWIRLGERSPLAAVDRPLAAYRLWPDSMSSDVDRQRDNHDRVVSRHRGDVSTELTRPLDEKYRQYLARGHLRARRRWGGFVDYLDIAVRFRRPTQLVSAFGALLAPGATERFRATRELAKVPTDWVREARAWLDHDGADLSMERA